MSQTADEISVRRKPAGIPGGVFVALILVAFLYGGLRVARRPRLVGKGALAPSFTLERYGGGRISLDELRGKVVLLNFWATWCPPCVEEMPSLLKVAREYESQGFVLIWRPTWSLPTHGWRSTIESNPCRLLISSAVMEWCSMRKPDICRSAP